MLTIAAHKTALPFGQTLFPPPCATVLVWLAVWLSLGARNTSDTVAAALFPVSAFVAAGF